jgi:Mg2+-importing ATPase
VLILIFAAALSFFLGEKADTVIILGIVLVSGLLGFIQEKGAVDAVDKLMSIIEIKATVYRDGKETDIPIDEVVPGDVVALNAGDAIPGDCAIIESKDLFVDEAVLTGETYPVEKAPGVIPEDTPLAKRSNSLFMGTHVVSGTAIALVAKTGKQTEFGEVAQSLKYRQPETEFERGIRQFGYLLLEVTLMLVIFIFAVNVYLKRPVIEAFLFSVALAVGLTPQLLPAIISINLATGAKRMAKEKVIVRRLASIEDFGSMNVLCSDKTGTLTEGSVKLDSAIDINGSGSGKVFYFAYLNASMESGFTNPIDTAIINAHDSLKEQLRKGESDSVGGGGVASSVGVEGGNRDGGDVGSGSGDIGAPGGDGNRGGVGGVSGGISPSFSVDFSEYEKRKWEKLDEIPYDFVRKRLSVLVRSTYNNQATNLLIAKGAFKKVLSICTSSEDGNGNRVDFATASKKSEEVYQDLSSRGLRAIGVAYKDMRSTDVISKNSEEGLVFIGFIVLLDPLKEDITETINQLSVLGVKLKVITGDNQLVAASVGSKVGLSDHKVLTGKELQSMSDQALDHNVNRLSVFAEVEPNQKERIINALRRSGNVVGYLGDGINDAPALHAADVGISVDSAVDVAKEAADIVLLEKDLGVLCQGVSEGRATFANTLKYVFMATSANFGNMFSMAGASLFLPFLPLLPTQVLLTNFLTDLPELTISTDNVDQDWVDRPRRWDIKFIKRFMFAFGLLSSVFDYMTFGILLFILHASTDQFRTGWFIESVISASMIVLVVRTRKLFFKSMPSKYLLAMTLLVFVLVLQLPFRSIGKLFAFEPLPPEFLVLLGVVLVLYVAGAEITKRVFYRGEK